MEQVEPPGEDGPFPPQESTKIPDSVSPSTELNTTSSLEGLQTDEQRRVLDIVAQLRKCGLESILSLPQIVVCGDQSAGKSSVLEALTEIPFPRNDNLCTRFATEIILRRATTSSLTIRVIPDTTRPSNEQESIKAFKESITDFDELSRVMQKAMVLMGIASGSVSLQSRAFAKDILSVEIEGPSRPQLTLVDLPGLIQTETKGVTKADVELVAEITEHYISQPRTICLAVISATNDYANQGILTKVRTFDPQGERTLGIITKPDRLVQGSGMESAFLDLAKNEDIFFKLGWHVLKNRSFEEGASSSLERSASEATYFRKSVFSALRQDCVGIDALRERLSQMLFAHVKHELPKLREDLENALTECKTQLTALGNRRTTPQDCRAYLTQLSLDCYEICKAAVDGHYEGDYFTCYTDEEFSLDKLSTIRRLRAVVHHLNTRFSNNLRTTGSKYHIDRPKEAGKAGTQLEDQDPSHRRPDTPLSTPTLKATVGSPTKMSKSEAFEWVSRALTRSRGKELDGNYNPLLIGELFWEQSSNWQRFAEDHAENVAHVCTRFLEVLFKEKCPKDICSRLWSSRIQDVLKSRREASTRELDLIMEDIKGHPINYNHYYTDMIKKRREARQNKSLAECVESATQSTETYFPACGYDHTITTFNIDLATKTFSGSLGPDMEEHSCDEILDCLFSIYKVSQKTFIANVTTQVVERHVVRGLEKIFSPVVVNSLSDSETEAIASEPTSAKRQREFLDDRIRKLGDGNQILRDVMRGGTL